MLFGWCKAKNNRKPWLKNLNINLSCNCCVDQDRTNDYKSSHPPVPPISSPRFVTNIDVADAKNPPDYYAVCSQPWSTKPIDVKVQTLRKNRQKRYAHNGEFFYRENVNFF